MIMEFGESKIVILSDGKHTQDGGPMFEYFPKDIWSNHTVDGKTPYKTDEHNKITMSANCLLVKHPQGNVLIETGMHDKTPSYAKHHNVVKTPSLIESMKSIGIKPSDIDIVINSHLHPDHVGWNTISINGKLKPTFENAKYVVQRKEFQIATNPSFELRNDYFHIEKDVLPLEEAGCLELVDGEKEILPGIFVVPTPGHTAGHQSIIVKSDGKAMIYAADLAPLVFHVEKPRCKMSFDSLAREDRWKIKKKVLYDLAVENGWLIYFYHETSFTIGKLSKAVNAEGKVENKVIKI